MQYQCTRCNHKFTALHPSLCPNCKRSNDATYYRNSDDPDFWLTTFIILSATNDTPYLSNILDDEASHTSSSSYSNYDSCSSPSYDNSSSSDSSSSSGD